MNKLIDLKIFLQFMAQHNIRFIKRSGIPTNSFNGITFYRKNKTDKKAIRDFIVTDDDGKEIVVSLSTEEIKSLCF